jgi:hypothetical protein
MRLPRRVALRVVLPGAHRQLRRLPIADRAERWRIGPKAGMAAEVPFNRENRPTRVDAPDARGAGAAFALAHRGPMRPPGCIPTSCIVPPSGMSVLADHGNAFARKHKIEQAFVAVTLAAVWIGWSGSVRADPKTEALALFETGRAEATRGDCRRAIDHFSQARVLYRTAGSLYNIADCEERIGRLVSARVHWAELLGELAAGDARIADAQAHIEALDRRIPTVKLVLPPGAPKGTSIVLDGAPVAPDTVGAEQPMDPGQHTIVVEAPGRARRSEEVVVAEGARGFIVRADPEGFAEGAPLTAIPAGGADTLAAAPVNEAAPLGPSTARPSAGAPARSTLAYAAGAVGVIGLATSVVGTAVLLGKKSSIADHCDDTKACDRAGLDATGGVSTWSAIATVGFGVGAAGMIGFFLLPREATGETSSDGRARATVLHQLAFRTTIGRDLTEARIAVTW